MNEEVLLEETPELPEPEAPTNTTKLRSAMSRVTPLTAITEPKRRVTASQAIIDKAASSIAPPLSADRRAAKPRCSDSLIAHATGLRRALALLWAETEETGTHAGHPPV